MYTWIVAAAAALSGVAYGSKRLEDGQLEYILQLDPAAVAALKSGAEFRSEIPPEKAGVRRVCVRFGNQPVPHEVAKPIIDVPGPQAPEPIAADADGEPSGGVPWLTLAIVGLCASLAANFYQGWFSIGLRKRYRRMVEQMYVRGQTA